MAYNEKLAERLRAIMGKRLGVTEKKMFGGLSFLLKGKMCCGILGKKLVVRVSPEASDQLVKQPHVSFMDFTGRPMKGFLYVDPLGYKTEKMLANWVERGIAYLSLAKRQK